MCVCVCVCVSRRGEKSTRLAEKLRLQNARCMESALILLEDFTDNKSLKFQLDAASQSRKALESQLEVTSRTKQTLESLLTAEHAKHQALE